MPTMYRKYWNLIVSQEKIYEVRKAGTFRKYQAVAFKDETGVILGRLHLEKVSTSIYDTYYQVDQATREFVEKNYEGKYDYEVFRILTVHNKISNSDFWKEETKAKSPKNGYTTRELLDMSDKEREKAIKGMFKVDRFSGG